MNICSMRENPYENTGKSVSEVDYAGDNFVRYSGDTSSMAQTQMFAWDAKERGTDVHLQADPTRLELLQRTFKVKKEDFEQDKRDSVIQKYGGVEHFDAPPKELLLAQTESYVEYSRSGTVIKGQEKAKTKSKYVEDVYIQNHTAVWGSYWVDGLWGYACCKSTVKMSYCVGDAMKAFDTENANNNVPADGDSPGKSGTSSGVSKRQDRLIEKHSSWKAALGISDGAGK